MSGTESAVPAMSQMKRLERSILIGLSRARSVSGSFPAQFSGLRYESVGDGQCTVRLPHTPQVSDAYGNFGVAAIPMLCDYSLGGAVRSRVGRAATTPTVSLQIEYTAWPISSTDIICRAAFHGWLGGLATATATLETPTGLELGSAYGRFLVQVRAVEAGFSEYPWEMTGDVLALTELTESERQARSFLLNQAASCPTGLDGKVLTYDRLYGIVVDGTDFPDAPRLRQPTGPHLTNRSGFVFGGVTAGLLIDGCLRVPTKDYDTPRRILSSSCTFVRPGRMDRGDLFACAELVFDGRRLGCVAGSVIDATGTCLAKGEVLVSKGD